MKRLALFVAAPIILVLIFLSFGFFWWSQNSKPVSSNNETLRFVIPKGYIASQTAQKLYEQKLIKSPLAFKVYVQVRGISGKIQAGEYDLSQNSSLPKLVETLLKGPTSVWITIPEGLRREEIAIKFAQSLIKNKNQQEVFLNDFMQYSKGKEGFLFPDTYLFPRDMSGEKIVNFMSTTFDKKISSYSQDIELGSLNPNQIVTLASLIEREAKGEEERPIIAGILIKRANAGWPLQVDAAVQYAVATDKCIASTTSDCNWWPILTKEDLQIISRFNTYKYPGFPPSPVSNPGLSSIKAAVFPQDSPYWFYLHDNEGVIHFAKTIEEHNENIRNYLGK
ncbi:MAG TPA: endolytic transglycosylase MltG [Patescibacteria group bacterium]|nr:endolytic transglycosylase MltG [Patescibacteria group bacterium]